MSVQRGPDKLELTLTPRSGWGGRGLLGCVVRALMLVWVCPRSRGYFLDARLAAVLTDTIPHSCHIVPYAP